MKNKILDTFYEAYFNSIDRTIKLETINNEVFYCCILGFFYKNEIIYKWHVAIFENNNYVKLLNTQFHCKKHILVSSIRVIEFEANNQIIKL